MTDKLIYLLPLAGYLMGSISSAILLSKLMGIEDPRQMGSGNPGATNILRYGGKKLAALTLLGDVLKGVIPVLIARMLTADAWIIGAVMVAAFLGHLYPVFFGFKGGKGVATAVGVFSAVNPLVGLMWGATWLAVVFVSRYSSLSGLTASALAPVFMYWQMESSAYWILTTAITVMLFWRHRANIQRLLAGEESKVSLFSKKKAPE